MEVADFFVQLPTPVSSDTMQVADAAVEGSGEGFNEILMRINKDLAKVPFKMDQDSCNSPDCATGEPQGVDGMILMIKNALNLSGVNSDPQEDILNILGLSIVDGNLEVIEPVDSPRGQVLKEILASLGLEIQYTDNRLMIARDGDLIGKGEFLKVLEEGLERPVSTDERITVGDLLKFLKTMEIKPADGRTERPADGQTVKPAGMVIEKPADGPTIRLADGQAERPVDGQTVIPADGKTVKPADGQTVKPADGQTVKLADGQTVKPVDGQTVKPADGQTVKPADGQTVKLADGQAGIAADGQAERPTDGQTVITSEMQIERPADGRDVVKLLNTLSEKSDLDPEKRLAIRDLAELFGRYKEEEILKEPELLKRLKSAAGELKVDVNLLLKHKGNIEGHLSERVLREVVKALGYQASGIRHQALGIRNDASGIGHQASGTGGDTGSGLGTVQPESSINPESQGNGPQTGLNQSFSSEGASRGESIHSRAGDFKSYQPGQLEKSIMDQMVERARISVNQRESRINMTLKPEFLGKLQMEVTCKQGHVAINVVVENQAVKGMIQANLDRLIEAFENQGLTMGDLSVTVGGGQHDPAEERREGHVDDQIPFKLEEDEQVVETDIWADLGSYGPIHGRLGRINLFA